MFKFKTENNLTLCLIMSENIYKKVTGETLNIFSELMLSRIHQSIKVFLPDLHDVYLNSEEKISDNKFIATLDSIMFENALIIYEEFQNQ